MSDRTSLLAAALDAAGRGWPVFPLVPGGKRPAIRNWEQRATTDPDRIRRCWSAGPYNIGLATGPAGLLVVDLDVAKPDKPTPDGIGHGLETLTGLCERHGQELPVETRTVETVSGGWHLYFTAPADDTEYRNSAGKLGRLIDTRAHGGYVVAPGSTVDGRAYTVTEDVPVVPLPGWLAALLRPVPLPPPPPAPVPLRALVVEDRRDRYLRAAIDAEVARVEGSRGGERNNALYLAACALGQLVAGGALTDHFVRDRLLHAAAGHIAVNAYTLNTAHQTITSGLKAGARRPRQVAA